MEEKQYHIEPTGFGGSKDRKGKDAIGGFPLAILKVLNIPLQNGLRKGYKEHDWMDGLPYTDLKEAMLRHLSEHDEGKDIDPDGDIPHIYAVAWNACVMALNYYYGRDKLDNRWLEDKLKEAD